MLIPDNETEIMKEKLTKGKFPDNSAALLDVYERYITELKKKGFVDDKIAKAYAEGKNICVTSAAKTETEHVLWF